MAQDNELTVTLTLDNDEEVTCTVLTIFTVNDRDYIALLPLEEDDTDEEGEVYLYRFIDHGEDTDPELLNIEDDDEYEAVSDAFDEWLDTLEYEDLPEDE